MEKFSKDLGPNLRQCRESRNLTQVDLEALTKINQETISKIESGFTQNPKLETILKLCSALKVDLTEIVYGKLWKGPE